MAWIFSEKEFVDLLERGERTEGKPLWVEREVDPVSNYSGFTPTGTEHHLGRAFYLRNPKEIGLKRTSFRWVAAKDIYLVDRTSPQLMIMPREIAKKYVERLNRGGDLVGEECWFEAVASLWEHFPKNANALIGTRQREVFYNKNSVGISECKNAEIGSISYDWNLLIYPAVFCRIPE